MLLVGNFIYIVPFLLTLCVTVKLTITYTFFCPILSLFCDPNICKLKLVICPRNYIHLDAAGIVYVIVYDHLYDKNVKHSYVVSIRDIDTGICVILI